MLMFWTMCSSTQWLQGMPHRLQLQNRSQQQCLMMRRAQKTQKPQLQQRQLRAPQVGAAEAEVELEVVVSEEEGEVALAAGAVARAMLPLHLQWYRGHPTKWDQIAQMLRGRRARLALANLRILQRWLVQKCRPLQAVALPAAIVAAIET